MFTSATGSGRYPVGVRSTAPSKLQVVRVAMVTESFLPQVNGVTVSVLRMCEQLGGAGHEVLVVAPGTGPSEWAGAQVVRVPSVPVPGYATHRVAFPWPGLATTLRSFRPA